MKMLRVIAVTALFLLSGCYFSTQFDGPVEIVLFDGRSFSCIGGIVTCDNNVWCYLTKDSDGYSSVATLRSRDVAEIRRTSTDVKQ